jgi:crossover junction endodeoxyribonuclease RuvC
MTILGIDPGTTRVGYGIIETKNNNLIFKDYGCLFFEKINPEERLIHIFNGIKDLIEKEKPDIVAIEKIFFSKNKKTALEVSEARGVIIVAALANKIKLRSYTPPEVKQAVTSYGRAGKKEVQKMVRLLLNLKEDPNPDDAADALAVAITCAQHIKIEQN